MGKLRKIGKIFCDDCQCVHEVYGVFKNIHIMTEVYACQNIFFDTCDNKNFTIYDPNFADEYNGIFIK